MEVHDELKYLVSEFLPKSKGCVFCGIHLDEMTREELMSVCMMSQENIKSEREELRRRTDFLLS